MWNLNARKSNGLGGWFDIFTVQIYRQSLLFFFFIFYVFPYLFCIYVHFIRQLLRGLRGKSNNYPLPMNRPNAIRYQIPLPTLKKQDSREMKKKNSTLHSKTNTSHPRNLKTNAFSQQSEHKIVKITIYSGVNGNSELSGGRVRHKKWQ